VGSGSSAIYAQLLTAQGATGQSLVFANVRNLGITNHVFEWTVQGGPAACTLVVQSSLDAVTWSTVSTQTCTSLGSYAVTGTYLYLTVNLTALSGGTNPNISVNYRGFLPGQGLPVRPAEGGTGTTTPFTAGSVPFAGALGVYQQDNANYFWDSVNHRLCLLSNACLNTLDVGAGLFKVTSAGALTAVNGTFNGPVAGTTGTFSGAVTAPSATVTGAVQGATGVITGADGLTVAGRIVPSYFYVEYRQTAGETPTTATVWAAPEGCKLVGVVERHKVLGTDAGAVTISVAKDPTGTAPGAGIGLLTAALSLKTTNNTNQSGALSGTLSDVTFAAGDGLSVVLTGTMTAVAGVSVTFKFQRL